MIGDNGDQYGVVSIGEARQISDDKGLDLVEVSPNAKPPVVKLIDYGKFKYEQQKKASEAKKKQVVVQLKEIQFRPAIDTHDLNVKLKKAEKFLGQGDKVKMIMQFRGREMAHQEIGMELLKRVEADLAELGSVEQYPKMEGRQLTMVIAPKRKN